MPKAIGVHLSHTQDEVTRGAPSAESLASLLDLRVGNQNWLMCSKNTSHNMLL